MKSTAMGKITSFSAVLILFLLVPASITWAQTATLSGTVSIEQDYRVVNFSSPNGNVKVILPGNLSGPGQGTVLLSGTVTTNPGGKTEKEKTNNLKALQKMLLNIGGKSIPILPGQNHFDFSMPVKLTTPVSIDLADPGGNRATVDLKNLVMSPPPATSSLPAGQPSLFTDQKVFITNGNIPVYAANNNSTLFQPTDRFFTTDASGNKTEANVMARSPTQTVLSSQGFQTGITTIIRQSASRTDQVKVRMANLTLSSPNTNLEKGQSSSVTATIDPKITDKDSAEAMQVPIMQFDIKNLTPGVIVMTGGNLQVMTFPTKPNSINPAYWQITRSIVGVKPGNFNISATLYPSSSIANNPAITQQKALTHCTQYNTWINAVKKQLENFISITANNDSKDFARFVISSLPACSSEEELDVNKMAATNLLRDIPSSANLATGIPALAAYKAASDNIVNQTAPVYDFVHTDIIQQGLKLIENKSILQSDPSVKQNIIDAQQATRAVENDYSEKNIKTLAAVLQKLNTSAFISNLFISFIGKNVDLTKSHPNPVEEIGDGVCPQNFVSSDENIVIMARGCTEEEAKKKVYKELLEKAKKLRKDKNAGDCIGTCPNGGECTLTTPIGTGELTCVPADVKGCDGGFVAVFIGVVRAECLCAH